MAKTAQVKSKSPSRQKLTFVGGLVVLLVIIGTLAYLGHHKPTASTLAITPQPTASPVATPVGQTTKNAPTTSPTPTPPITTNLVKPTLSKSSGNAPGSSVPSGVIVEFTCTGTINSSCVIVLQSQSDASQTIRLTAKPVADNGRGEYFALWDWTSVAGNWSVTAVTTAPGQAGTTSDAQTLEVKS